MVLLLLRLAGSIAGLAPSSIPLRAVLLVLVDELTLREPSRFSGNRGCEGARLLWRCMLIVEVVLLECMLSDDRVSPLERLAELLMPPSWP